MINLQQFSMQFKIKNKSWQQFTKDESGIPIDRSTALAVVINNLDNFKNISKTLT